MQGRAIEATGRGAEAGCYKVNKFTYELIRSIEKMSNGLAIVDEIEQVVINGDLSRLQPAQRLAYYRSVCDSLGLNPLTRPFDYITLNGKLTLYAKRDATDQLRKIHSVSITGLERELVEDIYTVVAHARDKEGRTDTAIGAVSVANLKGDARANAIMKCETKAKRRVTLSIVGLGWLDETEIETIPTSSVNVINVETGEVLPSRPKPDSLPVAPVVKPENGGKEKPWKFPSTASEKFYNEVQKATGNYYTDGEHLEKTLGGWFNFGSQELWQERLSYARDMARQPA